MRSIARRRLRAGRRNTLLDTASLVHESYLRFTQAGRLRVEDRIHFMHWAGRVMRCVIVDFARRRLAARRGGGVRRVTLTVQLPAGPGPARIRYCAFMMRSTRWPRHDPRLAQVVEMKYFAGMTEPEIAESLGVTDRTVRRDWEKARLLLRTMLK